MSNLERLVSYLKQAKANNWTMPGFKVLAQEYGISEQMVKECFDRIFNR